MRGMTIKGGHKRPTKSGAGLTARKQSPSERRGRARVEQSLKRGGKINSSKRKSKSTPIEEGVTPMKMGGKIARKIGKKRSSKQGRRASENRGRESSPRTPRSPALLHGATPTARRKAKVLEAQKLAKKAKRGVQPDKVKALRKRLKPKGIGAAQRGWGKTGKH